MQNIQKSAATYSLELQKLLLIVLSGSFPLGWTKAGMTIVRDPDHKGMIGTHYQSPLHTPKGFGLGPLMAEIWAFFQILGDFQLFYFEAIDSHGTCFFHRTVIKITYNVQKFATKIFQEKNLKNSINSKIISFFAKFSIYGQI